MKILNYIFVAIIGGLLALNGLQFCTNQSTKKQLTKSQLQYSILNDKWWKLITQPPRIITVSTPAEVVNNHPIIPTPIPDANPTPPPPPGQKPPVDQSDSCKSNRYNETYHIGDSIHIWWTAKTKGYIREFNINKVSYPSQTTTKTIYVPCDPVDTTAILGAGCKVKSSLWIYAKPLMIVSPFKIANVTAGLQWEFKRKWGVGAGAGYDWNINSPIVEGILLFNINNK